MIEFKQTQIAGSAPVIWRGEAKVLPAGFKPAQTFPVGVIVKRGTPVFVDFATMSAAVCKAALVLDGGTTSKIRVNKSHLFAVGDVVAKNGTTSTTTIKSIDTSNAEYDVIEVTTAITGIAKNDALIEAAEGGAAKYAPNAIVAADVEFNGKGIPTIDAAYEACVLSANVSYPVLAEWLNGFCLKSNPNILFIKQ